MNKYVKSFLFLFIIVISVEVLKTKVVQAWILHHYLKLTTDQALQFKCYSVEVPYKWLFNIKSKSSSIITNNNRQYSVMKFSSAKNKYVFASISTDYDNKMSDNLTAYSKVVNIVDVKHTIYKIWSGNPDGSPAYVVKLDGTPFILYALTEELVIDLLKGFTESNENLINFTCDEVGKVTDTESIW